MPTMNLIDHYHFLIEELDKTHKEIVGVLNRGGSKKRRGTELSRAQDILLDVVFSDRRNRLKSLIVLEQSDEAMRKIND